MSAESGGTLHDLLTKQIPPHSLEAERAVLGAVLLEPGALAVVSGFLGPTDFYKGSHRLVFDAAVAVVASGQVPDLLTVQERLKLGGELEEVGGVAALAGLVEEAALLANLASYCTIIRDHATKRDLIRLSTTIIGEAYNGNLPAELLQTAGEQIARLTGRSRPAFREPVTLAALEAAPPPEPAWLIQDLILEQSNGWIGAAPKVGKSYVMADLAIACAEGEPWLGRFAVARRLTVAIIENEDSLFRLFTRCTRLCRARGIPMPSNLHVLVRGGVQLDDLATLDPLLAWLERRRVDVVFWDVFNKLHTKDERRPDQVLPILKTVDRIRDELASTNMILHHNRKPGVAGPDLSSGGQKLRGPSELWGWAENSLYLSPVKGGLVIEPESKDVILEPFKVHLEDLPDGGRRWIYDGVVQSKTAQAEATRESILEVLKGRPQQTAAQIAEAVSLSEKQVKRHLKTLREDGAVTYDTAPDRSHTRLWSASEGNGTRRDDETPF